MSDGNRVHPISVAQRRREILAILDEMVALTQTLRERGIDPGQAEDREAGAILKRIIERAYGG